METQMNFNAEKVLHKLKHYLPAQAPLKDFIHHNSLHAFQDLKFFDALRQASGMFGYKVTLSLDEFRSLYNNKKIKSDILHKTIESKKGIHNLEYWKRLMLSGNFNVSGISRVGSLRSQWRQVLKIDIDTYVHSVLFRIICSYLDQGIASWNFPADNKSFLDALTEIEKNSFSSFFKTRRARNLLLNNKCSIPDLLKILVGKEDLYERYLFDQQFAHQGWSGMVSTIEDHPETLLKNRRITMEEIIQLELLLEIDVLDKRIGSENWKPISEQLIENPSDLFSPVLKTEFHEVTELWQEAYEWTYYDELLAALKIKTEKSTSKKNSFQAFFCIDDRESSLRTYIEKEDPLCETYATPGFFHTEFFYRPSGGRFYSKLCPAPVTPKYLIKEISLKAKGPKERDVHFTKHTHGLFQGWLIAQSVGFWSAFKLFLNIFKPSLSPATASSFKHMDKSSKLTIENINPGNIENGLQIGFTVPEMADRIENLLGSTGLVKDFAPLIYFVSHGASSVNNPHYAAYDCGACSGRPGSVNARVAAFMANHEGARKILKERGIDIPAETIFIGALHDTTRDEVSFFDEDQLSSPFREMHVKNTVTFFRALDLNSKERSRRFESINTSLSPKQIHEKILRRSVSLFEPRPELNHATNALCIIGRRDLSRNIFMDRRAFMNSYNYQIDPDGKYLLNILNAAAPVCGGINLEYYFSRVDNHKLGAGTKLPHNVMGLFGVANGIDGDLRPGLPSQMIEVHDPVRLLMIVEHFPETVLKTIQQNPDTYTWFKNEWIHLITIHPETGEQFLYKNEAFGIYHPLAKNTPSITNPSALIETSNENLPVTIITHE